jgi:protein HOOK3
MTQYLSDALHQPNGTYEVPALQEMAKDGNPRATLAMCRLVVSIAIQCEHNADIITRIQGLGEGDQAELKKAIEQVRMPEFYPMHRI